MTSYNKTDVKFHSDGFGREALPAVNVKVRRGLDQIDFSALEEIPESLTLEWIERTLSEEDIDRLFWRTCQNEWEMVEQDAETIFDAYSVTVESQGRSGGWACVSGLPDIGDWDAVLLAKWRKFERFAKDIARYVPEQMVYSLALNEWEWDQARQAEEAGLHLDVAKNVAS